MNFNMSWLKRKQKDTPVEPSTSTPKVYTCPHLWQDFPWYAEATYDGARRIGICNIYEPYVCIYCKERKDILLQTIERSGSWEDFNQTLSKISTDPDYQIQSRAVIEDSICDMQLVDRRALEIARSLGLTTELGKHKNVKPE